ncbi:MAG: hypothetical protein Q8S73_23615 [Deltaproteobacteria bacterium]|nr:hypothetical protein [Myxococcales bacterium]MDP3217119.1 hypothetical protein [Deltaproteobacteria bacterium]
MSSRAPSDGTGHDEELVERWYDDEERSLLLRYLRLSGGDEFQLAAVEVATPAVRRALLAWLRERLPDRSWFEVSLKGLPGVAVRDEIVARLPPPDERGPRMVLVLTDLEETAGAALESHPSFFMRLNLERDPLVRDLPLTCLLLAHPAALLKLRLVAPDFCHYFSTLIRQRALGEGATLEGTGRTPAPTPSLSPSGWLELSDSEWPTLLRAADHAMACGEIDRARDHLAEFRATNDAGEWGAEAGLLAAALAGSTDGAKAGLAVLESLPEVDSGQHVAAAVRGLLLRAGFERESGRREAADIALQRAIAIAETSARSDLRAAVLKARAAQLANGGSIDEALAILVGVQGFCASTGRAREAWDAAYQVAKLRFTRGEWASVIDLCERELMPNARSLHDQRLAAIATGLRASVLEARGDLDEALRIRREEELPVYERLGDVRARAVSLGEIADVLEARGDLDEALRIRREEELPVYERLGDVRSRAATLGKIADVLEARGDLDEALRIWREEELPVYERLGDVRERAVILGKIAEVLQARGSLDEALRILRNEVMPCFERLGLRREAAIAQGNLGVVLSRKGRVAEALTQLERARDELDSLGAIRDQIDLRIGLSQIHWRANNHKGALRESQAALSRAEAQREPSYLARALRNMIPLLLALGQTDEARTAFDRATTILAEDAHWDTLKQVDPLGDTIARAAAPRPKPSSKGRRIR